MLGEKVRHSPRKGLLIAIEGIDGAGKTTQAQGLKKHLEEKGHDVVVLKEPTMGRWGKEIALMGKHGRHLSAEEESDYFLEDRKEDVAQNILPALMKGQTIIMDRYYYSNMAYQGAKGMNPNLIEEENLKFAPKPQITILLDITPTTAKKRIFHFRNGERNSFEKRLGPVRKVFLDIAKTHSEVKLIKGDENVDAIQSKIVSLVVPLLLEYER